jgi:hemerythrin
MALIQWESKYSVGVSILDNQHMILFDLMNELHNAMLKGKAHSLTGPILYKLLEYANEHFSAEEEMLATAQYPGLADHRLKHQEIKKQVNDYTARMERGEITINIHLMEFLRDWLTDHLMKVDQEYSLWLHNHGVL